MARTNNWDSTTGLMEEQDNTPEQQANISTTSEYAQVMTIRDAALKEHQFTLSNVCNKYMKAIQKIHLTKYGVPLTVVNVQQEDVDAAVKMLQLDGKKPQQETHPELERLINTREKSTLTDVFFADLDADGWTAPEPIPSTTAPELITSTTAPEPIPSTSSQSDRNRRGKQPESGIDVDEPNPSTSSQQDTGGSNIPEAIPSTSRHECVEEQERSDSSDQSDTKKSKKKKTRNTTRKENVSCVTKALPT